MGFGFFFFLITFSPCALRLFWLKSSFCLRHTYKTVEINVSHCVIYTQKSLKHWEKCLKIFSSWLRLTARLVRSSWCWVMWQPSEKKDAFAFAQRWKRSHKLALNLRTLLNKKQACLSPLARHCYTLLRLNWKVVSVCTLVDTQFGVLARSANKYSIARDF